VNATENAIAAFGKALEFRGDLIQDEKGAVETWVSYLPVTRDRIEARQTYARLIRFLSGNRKHIWGADLSLLPHILSVLLTILGSKLVEKELNPKILAVLNGIQSFPPQAVQVISWTICFVLMNTTVTGCRATSGTPSACQAPGGSRGLRCGVTIFQPIAKQVSEGRFCKNQAFRGAHSFLLFVFLFHRAVSRKNEQ
jgi:hypothetical protein